EGIDNDEVFAPVVRLEAIRIFLAFALYMGLIVYQMDVKSAFLYGKIDEEVYVSQPPGFLDPKYPEKVYKVVKALYGNENDMTLQNVYDLCLSLCKQVSDQAKEIKLLKAKITKLTKQAKPVIKHHKAYLKIVLLQQRFPRKSFSKKHRLHRKSVSKQGRKIAKGESSVQTDLLFDVMPEDKIDHMET
ncbi:copia protein, partial [Tanacetum coccineum]